MIFEKEYLFVKTLGFFILRAIFQLIVATFFHPKKIRDFKVHDLPKFENELFPSQNATWGINAKQNYEQNPRNPTKSDQLPPFQLRFFEILSDLPFILRYYYHNFSKLFWSNKAKTFDYLEEHNLISKPDNKGPSLGGIGGGNIIRSTKGDFSRWHLHGKAGINYNGNNPVNNFHLFVKNGNSSKKNYILNFNELDNFQDLLKSKSSLCGWKFYCKDNKHYETLDSYFFSRFPKSWYVYDEKTANIRIICKQFSPIIAHNYKETSYPTGVFEYEIKNLPKDSKNQPDQEKEISLMLTFGNELFGLQQDSEQKELNKHSFLTVQNHSNYIAIRYHVQLSRFNGGCPFIFSISVQKQNGNEISLIPLSRRDNKTEMDSLIYKFSENGSLEHEIDLEQNSEMKVDSKKTMIIENEIVMALCCKVKMQENDSSTKKIVFALNWDKPLWRLGGNNSRYLKKYTEFTGETINLDDTKAISSLENETFANFSKWSQQIDDWQKPVIENQEIPNFLKAHSFNELYYTSDSGNYWTIAKKTDKNPKTQKDEFSLVQKTENDGQHFGYQEGHPYLMLNTYDVHFYAAFSWLMFWPKIQLLVERDFSDQIPKEDNEIVLYCGSNQLDKRKQIGCVPHDLGIVDEEPFEKVNAYCIQNVNRWKDLNSEFVISVFRDFVFLKKYLQKTGSSNSEISEICKKFLNSHIDRVKLVMNTHLERYDKHGTGVIENENFADSTYDAWKVKGVSVYSGGLWLSAMRVAVEMCKILEINDNWSTKITNLLPNAIKHYENRLWKDGYYYYDDSGSENSNSLMADALQGHFNLLICEIEPILPKDRVKSMLNKIYEFNFKKFNENLHKFSKDSKKRGLGVVNGMKIGKIGTKIDEASFQSRETWIGVCYTLAALLILEGEKEKGLEIVESIYEGVWNCGFHFQTPEAILEDGRYRAASYMRALSISSVLYALNNKQFIKKEE